MSASGLHDCPLHAMPSWSGRGGCHCGALDANRREGILRFEAMGCSRTCPFPNRAHESNANLFGLAVRECDQRQERLNLRLSTTPSAAYPLWSMASGMATGAVLCLRYLQLTIFSKWNNMICMPAGCEAFAEQARRVPSKAVGKGIP
ncbi:hypothetical protein B5F40_10785 [Gordonibacter sp. An230]|nr:hypothetical protein B5F40_10785 [Gordonibacter sp. An230]